MFPISKYCQTQFQCTALVYYHDWKILCENNRMDVLRSCFEMPNTICSPCYTVEGVDPKEYFSNLWCVLAQKYQNILCSCWYFRLPMQTWDSTHGLRRLNFTHQNCTHIKCVNRNIYKFWKITVVLHLVHFWINLNHFLLFKTIFTKKGWIKYLISLK